MMGAVLKVGSCGLERGVYGLFVLRLVKLYTTSGRLRVWENLSGTG